MGKPAAARVELIRVKDLLQTHVTPALCQAAFRRVRRTERQRVWTLHALVQFWTAVVRRAPQALSQALADAVADREPLFPHVPASPEAFFQRCRDLQPAFFERRTARRAAPATRGEDPVGGAFRPGRSTRRSASGPPTRTRLASAGFENLRASRPASRKRT